MNLFFWVDFIALKGLDNPDEPSKDTKERIAQELDTVLSTLGFVYVKNHGISSEKVTESK